MGMIVPRREVVITLTLSLTLTLTLIGKDRAETRSRDYTLEWLGYSTDNGAWMYYNPEPHKTYEASTAHNVQP